MQFLKKNYDAAFHNKYKYLLLFSMTVQTVFFWLVHNKELELITGTPFSKFLAGHIIFYIYSYLYDVLVLKEL